MKRHISGLLLTVPSLLTAYEGCIPEDDVMQALEAGCVAEYFVSDNEAQADFGACFVAEARVGDVARGSATWEVGISADGAPIDDATANFGWDVGAAHDFELTWDGATASFDVDGARVSMPFACDDVNALQLRARGQRGILVVWDVELNGVDVGCGVSVFGDGIGRQLDILQLACDFENAFSLRGKMTMIWFPQSRPASSQLALQISAGTALLLDPDCDGDGVPDALAIPAGDALDCNLNGIPDLCDLEQGVSEDENNNNVPDECDPDCDGNGVPDDIDLKNAVLEDCDGNGIPDICENDADADGVIDACDGCPDDPNKTEPGDCGCGFGDVDLDGDGVSDCGGDGPCVQRFFESDGQAADGVDTCFVAEGRIGSSAYLGNFTFELDLSENTSAPQNQRDFGWRRGVSYPFALVWDGSTALFEVDNKLMEQQFACGQLNTLLVRGRSVKGGLHFSDLALNGAPLDADFSVGGSSGNDRQILRLECGALGDSFVLTGTVMMDWSFWNPPRNSQLAFQISAGYVEPDEPIADCDGNGVDDADDLANGAADCNGNGVLDVCDIEAGTAEDVNGNGVPDACETDCDGNGVPDDVDIQHGAPDCNENGVPDVCEPDADGDGVIDACDGCPDDPAKTEPGLCGCGVADTDSDGDGVPDCDDGCPDDPAKTEPGACGCGLSDADADGDGVPDCDDACPDDPAKSEPGDCGCGVADTDSDGDGVPDCDDGCPDDPAKTEPGDCGCGVADTDSDGDGVPDCDDGCPDDPAKTEPGACGCGLSDADADGDGVPDCDDACPDDPAKSEPGDCGCGVADTDSDGDGVPDCDDGCPDDPNKTEPGDCGCGVADTDSDGDGVPDCDDACPDDPAKSEPGACGCGVADTDSDGDGVPDCDDGCPDDPAKTEPGDCGCGVADTDSDGDGVPDCDDGCPDDPNKTDPGVCGCGVADTDSDGDGVPDCDDGCPDDPNKTEPGDCGCGVADTDSDGDGVPDCDDGCPDDPAKTEPGDCGCGVADTDSDGDGVPDCDDGCPDDPNKTDPGVCGCGVADTDSDGDGVPDCDDGCPDDPNKTDPGVCGCGVADADNDGDGLLDCEDLCPNSTFGVPVDEDGCELLSVDAGSDVTLEEVGPVELSPTVMGGVPPYSYAWSAPDWAGATQPNPVVLPSATTVYTLTVTDSSSPPQQVSDSVTVTVVAATGLQYTIEDLGALSGNGIYAQGMNDAGVVVGFYYDASFQQRAFRWEAGVLTDLGTLGGATANARDINSAGQIVGEATDAVGWPKAFVYTSGSGMQSLGMFDGPFSSAYAINDLGEVVGYAELGATYHAFLYQGGPFQTLDTEGYALSSAYDINDHTQVVGALFDNTYQATAFFHDGAALHDLGSPLLSESHALVIGNSGLVVGHSWSSGEYISYIYLDDMVVDMGVLDGYAKTFGYGINDAGQVVGACTDDTETSSAACIYTGGELHDLYGLLVPGHGWTSLQVAEDVNGSGQIVGYGVKGGQTRAFMLTPVE